MAFSGQGTKFFWCLSTLPSTMDTGQLIGEVINFSGPGADANVIDVTHMESTAKESLMGLRDPGEVSITFNYNATDAGQLALIADNAARTKKKSIIKFADSASSLAIFDAYCLGFTISGGVDDKVTGTARLKLADACTFTTVAVAAT